ncbi:MAG: hypothetical protein KatS3mg014_1636 [Actinomycetota bacterium]|nr:MAG: hypothetical protein KatS3mg014_1636 [Actinomycetota bacterium]
MALLLSSCFVLNDFRVGAATLTPGQKTTAFFSLYPASTTSDTSYQFVLVGVDDPAQLGIGKATWGTNGTFGGPVPMTLRGDLDDLFATPGHLHQLGPGLLGHHRHDVEGLLDPEPRERPGQGGPSRRGRGAALGQDDGDDG